MRTTSISLSWARDGLDLRVRMFREKNPKIYDKMVNTIPNREAFFRIAELGTFPAAGDVNEATGINYSDLTTPFFQDVYPQKRGVGFAVATEVLERDRYKVFNRWGPLMGQAIDKAMEIDIASLLNLATTGAVTSPDKVTVASTAHLYQFGTFSNILSTNAPLDYGSLEQALQELMVQPGHDGFPMSFIGPVDLWVPAQMWGLANRLRDTANGRVPQSYNNDKNWAGVRVREVIVNPLFTNPFAWALVVSEELYNPFIMIEGRKVKLRNQYDGDKDAEKFNATAIWQKSMKDSRGFIYSGGS